KRTEDDEYVPSDRSESEEEIYSKPKSNNGHSSKKIDDGNGSHDSASVNKHQNEKDKKPKKNKDSSSDEDKKDKKSKKNKDPSSDEDKKDKKSKKNKDPSSDEDKKDKKSKKNKEPSSDEDKKDKKSKKLQDEEDRKEKKSKLQDEEDRKEKKSKLLDLKSDEDKKEKKSKKHQDSNEDKKEKKSKKHQDSSDEDKKEKKSKKHQDTSDEDKKSKKKDPLTLAEKEANAEAEEKILKMVPLPSTRHKDTSHEKTRDVDNEGKEPIVLMGDFNASGSYLRKTERGELDELLQKNHLLWGISHDSDTTVATGDAAYDRFVFEQSTKDKWIGNTRIWRFDDGWADSIKEDPVVVKKAAKRVTDHYAI
ncbi:21014_t:CDS:2, partial [Dentiscutata erythropus]